ncbi:Pentatricopeptide repeat-containing protein [Ananas comosus]|uniref:Pentatricopeptide repeat-containing protein n=1 Tax=Ananas comosus TaxID=4615 RepID=A0A199VD30_ANACO|nr:Pentatricopeptide repeat-containing protein [Ananas comosus]
MEAIGSQSILSFSSNLCKRKVPLSSHAYCVKFKSNQRLEIVCRGMLAPRKFLRRRKKEEVFKDAADEAEQKSWRKMMKEIEESGSAVSILRTQRSRRESLPRDLVLGTLVRFKQLKKWNLVSEILEWLRTQHWWDFSEMDFLMLITAYGKLGDFNRAERVLKYMGKKGYPPSVISHTALMEAYGRSRQYSKAEAIFRRMQSLGPEPSPLTYQIILKTFVEGDKFKEAEAVFQSLLNDERSSFKPDQKMFHMMIYMYKKAGNFDQARKLFRQMAESGIPRSTVTFNSLMSFETDYKEVSKIYDQMQRAGLKPDVVSYALLISAYGKARREDEALAVFEEMLDAGVRCEPDLCSYATMLSAYVNASDMDQAEKFFRRIKEDGLKPNTIVYGTLMKGYAKLNNLEKVMRVYERMRVQGVEPNQTIFTTIMDAHGKNADFGSAIVWFKEMSARGFPPDQKAKNILLSLAKTEEEKHEANELVGNNADQIEAKFDEFTKFENDDDVDDEHEDELSDGETEDLEVQQVASDFESGFSYDDDDEDDDVDDDDDDDHAGELSFVSTKEKPKLVNVN